MKKLALPLLILTLIAVTIGFLTTIFMGLASFSYGLLTLGLASLKNNKQWHPKLMITGIAIDLLLVLTLEFQRSAINTAASFILEPIQQFHILCSLIATLGYFPVIFLGWKRLKGAANAKQLKMHKYLGILTYIFRSLGFLLMFSMLK